MQLLLEHLGVAVAAVTGALAARGKQVDLFGVVVLAVVTAFGGGTIRDISLGAPVFWVQDSRFVIDAFLAAVVTFYVVRWHELPALVLLVGDALVLAFFTMLGARKGLVLTGSPPIAIMMGVITGVAGGVIRDVLIGELPLVFRSETYLYATAAFFGALVYVTLARIPDYGQVDLIIGVAMTFLLRLAGIRWRIGLPLFRPKDTRPPGK